MTVCPWPVCTCGQSGRALHLVGLRTYWDNTISEPSDRSKLVSVTEEKMCQCQCSLTWLWTLNSFLSRIIFRSDTYLSYSSKYSAWGAGLDWADMLQPGGGPGSLSYGGGLERRQWRHQLGDILISMLSWSFPPIVEPLLFPQSLPMSSQYLSNWLAVITQSWVCELLVLCEISGCEGNVLQTPSYWTSI